MIKNVYSNVKKNPIKVALIIAGTASGVYLGKKHGGKVVKSLIQSKSAKSVIDSIAIEQALD